MDNIPFITHYSLVRSNNCKTNSYSESLRKIYGYFTCLIKGIWEMRPGIGWFGSTIWGGKGMSSHPGLPLIHYWLFTGTKLK